MQSGRDYVRNFIIGILVGIAAMLPGISGATLTVTLGIYERMIRDFADLKTWLRKDFAFIFILILGVGVGTVVSAKLLNGLITEYPAECMMLFLGLIIGSMPFIIHSAGKVGKDDTKGIVAFAIGFGIILLMILADVFLKADTTSLVTHDAAGFLLMVVVGVVIALSALTPGLSHSTVLIVLGLFGTFTGAIANADIFLLSAMAVGVIIGVLAFSKALNNAFENHHHVMMMLTLGLTVGSMLSVIVLSAPYLGSVVHIVASAVLLVIGIAVSAKFMKEE